MVANERSSMVSYLLAIVTICLGSTILELEQDENRDLDLTLQDQARSNCMVANESSYMVSYLLVIVTTCLGSTIF